MLRTLIYLILVSAILVGIYFAGNTVISMWKNQDSLAVQTPTALQKPLYKTEKISENDSQNKYSIDISYPVFTGLSEKSKQTTINNLIKTQVDTYIAGFEKEVSSASAMNLPADLQANLTITFTPAQMDDQIVSFAWNVSDMQAGAAHPNNYTNVFNYSVLDNQTITLSNLFLPNSNYLKVLSDISKPQLKKQLEKENYYFADMFDPGVSPTAKNYQNFLLGSSALTIIFDYYQVAPYVTGISKVSIPYTALQNILNPNIPL